MPLRPAPQVILKIVSHTDLPISYFRPSAILSFQESFLERSPCGQMSFLCGLFQRGVTIQFKHITSQFVGGNISLDYACCFSMVLYCLFSFLYYSLPALVVFFCTFIFFYPGNLIFILRATEFVGKPILHTQ